MRCYFSAKIVKFGTIYHATYPNMTHF